MSYQLEWIEGYEFDDIWGSSEEGTLGPILACLAPGETGQFSGLSLMWLIVDNPTLPRSHQKRNRYCKTADSHAHKECVLGHRKGWKTVAKCRPAPSFAGPTGFHHDQADWITEKRKRHGGSSLPAEMESVTPAGCFRFIFPQKADCITWYQNRNKIMPRLENFRLWQRRGRNGSVSPASVSLSGLIIITTLFYLLLTMHRLWCKHFIEY